MTTVVNVHEAKTQLSALLARAEAGEEIVIARAGKPVARLDVIHAGPRVHFGRGIDIELGEEFFAALPEEELAPWE